MGDSSQFAMTPAMSSSAEVDPCAIPGGQRQSFALLVDQIQRQVAHRLSSAHLAVLDERLGPQLVDLAPEQVGVDALNVARDGPEAASARIVLEIFAVVGRADENALPREIDGASSIGKARAIALTADERLDCAHVGAREAGQFRQFENPLALHEFDHAFRVVEIAVELAGPILAEHADERRLAPTLQSLEDDREIELVARLIDAGHGANIIRRPTLSV
jgi:hypothetical protein